MRLTALFAAFAGIFAGLSLLTFGYAQGTAYLTNDPAACANCHVMNEQLDGWRKSSHRVVAVCNDCHTPPGFAAKYATKAMNGFFHSLAFTTGRFPERIQITSRNREVTESACLKCHQALVDTGHRATMIGCLRCHSSVGH